MFYEIVKQQAKAVEKAKYDLIREAINREVGNDKWLPEEVKPRTYLHRYQDETEVLLFDNKPLIEFYPIEVSQTQEGEKRVINASFKYKLLYRI